MQKKQKKQSEPMKTSNVDESELKITIDRVSFPHPVKDRYPYASIDVLDFIRFFEIKIPFDHIVDKQLDGFSTCPVCGQVYRGYQGKCQKVQKFWCVKETFSVTDYFHTQFLKKKEASDFALKINSPHKIFSRTEECRGSCVWPKQEEFDEQERFFNNIDELGFIVFNVIENRMSNLIQYKHLMPEGQAELFEAEILRNRTDELAEQIERLYDIIKMAGIKIDKDEDNGIS